MLNEYDSDKPAGRMLVGGIELPVLMVSSVTHVGELDLSKKSRTSHEGHALSVSNCPDAWRHITRCQGQEWVLRPASGQEQPFIDAHALTSTDVDALMRWGEFIGLVGKSSAWRVEWFDEDLGEDVYALFDSHEEAAQEAADIGEDVTEVHVWRSTPALDSEHGTPRQIEPLLVRDLLLVSFATRHREVAGVWWNDAMRPEAYSAPRGALTAELGKEWMAELARLIEGGPEDPGYKEDLEEAPAVHAGEAGEAGEAGLMSDEECREEFDSGLCGVFAVALARRLKLDSLLILSNVSNDPWSDEIDFDITHVVVDHPTLNGVVADAYGWQPIEQVAGRFGMDFKWKDCAINGPYGPAELERMASDENDGPLPFCQSDMDQAGAYIERNLSLWTSGEPGLACASADAAEMASKPRKGMRQ